jgi:16S rRNA (cytosine1402-N4)-methyltransferase
MDTNQKPYHIPVLLEEVVEFLALKPGGFYVDCTFGGGGHTRALLEREPQCSVVALDWDTVALEKNGEPLKEIYGERLTLLWGNFSQVDKHLKKNGFDLVDGVLADFGTSQYQIFERPGFSFTYDSPLDMRMSPAHQKTTAGEVVNKATEDTLYEIFTYLGQERYARKIARALVGERVDRPIRTTGQLARLVEGVVGGKGGRRIHPATQIFQALRMYVNKELENINGFLAAAVRVLKPGGRLVCISFHSLEDRIVKQFFNQQKLHGFKVVTEKVVVPTQEEIAQNPASRSAKLRVLEKCV